MNDRYSGAETLIEAEGINFARQGREILSNVDFQVRAGEIVTLIGPNGAGKTTVVRIVLGLLDPDRGAVRRRQGLIVGYMPQRLHIDPTLPLTVGRFLALGAVRGGSYTRDRTAAVLAEVGAGTLMETPLEAVSGGEFQRIILARALLRNPDLLVLDEPSQGVDVNGQAELYDLIASIRDRHGLGVLLVSHDLHLVMANTDQVICLNHHVCCAGHPEMVTNDPSYIALFGKQVASAVAVYHHHHDHAHDADGSIIPLRPASAAGGNAVTDSHRDG